MSELFDKPEPKFRRGQRVALFAYPDAEMLVERITWHKGSGFYCECKRIGSDHFESHPEILLIDKERKVSETRGRPLPGGH